MRTCTHPRCQPCTPLARTTRLPAQVGKVSKEAAAKLDSGTNEFLKAIDAANKQVLCTLLQYKCLCVLLSLLQVPCVLACFYVPC